MDYTEVTVYRCEHCLEFHGGSIEAIEEHLTECILNPTNRSCARCNKILKVNDMSEDGKPVTWFYCNEKEMELLEFDIKMTDAECFEIREDINIPHKNSEAYMEYLKELVPKIQSTIKE